MLLNNLVIIGCGKMGSALVRGFLKQGAAQAITIVEHHDVPFHVEGITTHRSISGASDTIRTANVVILAIKPQGMDALCAELAPILASQTLIISIAAGTSMALFERYFGAAQPIIRVMPNTPAAIGQGMSVLCANAAADADRRLLAQALMQTCGATAWIADESLMNAVTALSGSGPAYVFALIEAMEKAGIGVGLPPDLSTLLARQTVIGAAALAAAHPDQMPAQLREAVTSPKGTTAAALDVLSKEGFFELMTRAVAAARDRGKELENSSQ
ncbi:MAG: pyrroline-5-carboxylate reductase [Alphaproteobacteria bacterium]|nr:pyrroline-5-carboxylate reductase [Alphaproteobacteria bacterium]